MPLRLPTELDDIITNGIDIKNRRLYFGVNTESVQDDVNGGDFTWENVEAFVRNLHILVAHGTAKPIELHMCSEGGDPLAMLYMLDEILACPCQVKFIGGGQVSSSATWIMAVCDERYLHRDTVILLHDSNVDFTVRGKLTDAKIEIQYETALQHRLEQIFAENSFMPKEFWTEILKRDVYISAEDAIILGLADEIIEPKKRGNLRKKRTACMNKNMDKKKINKIVKDIFKKTFNDVPFANLQVKMPQEIADPNIVIDESKDDCSEDGIMIPKVPLQNQD